MYRVIYNFPRVYMKTKSGYQSKYRHIRICAISVNIYYTVCNIVVCNIKFVLL